MVGADVGLEPMHLAAQGIVRESLLEQRVQRAEQCSAGMQFPREPTRVREDDAEMSLRGGDVLEMESPEVGDVLGHERALFVDRRGKELSVSALPKLRTFSDRDDVVSALTQFDGHRVVVVLIEQKPQRRAACSRRQAASCSSAASSLALISPSISSRLAA